MFKSIFSFTLVLLTLGLFAVASSAQASQSFVYLVGSITSYNNLATTSPSKFSNTTQYGPYYFSTLAACETVKTQIEGHRADVIPSAQQGNVIGASKENLLMVSTLQCLSITQ